MVLLSDKEQSGLISQGDQNSDRKFRNFLSNPARINHSNSIREIFVLGS